MVIASQRLSACTCIAVRAVLLCLFTSSLVAAQTNPRELVRRSIRNGEQAWKDSFEYSCVKHDIDHQFDSSGRPKQIENDVYEIIPLGYGSSFERHVLHDGEPLSPEEQAKADRELNRRRAETPAQKRHHFEKEFADRSYMQEVPDAFDFKIVRDENLPTGTAWVLEATPRPGYEPKSRYAHFFSKMRGTLWIDKKDLQWVKADAVAADNVNFGIFLARLSKGSHIILEQMKLADGAWVPKRIEAKAEARTFLIFNHNFEEDITYSNYRKTEALAASAR